MTEKHERILELAKDLIAKSDEYDRNNVPVAERKYEEIKEKMKQYGFKDYFSNTRK